MPELVQAVAGALQTGAHVEQVEELAESLSRVGGVELLDPGMPARPARFTTRELLAIEREALKLALDGRDVGAPCPDKRVLLRTLLPSRMFGSEQRDLVREASQRADRVVCAVGVAGAGKTSALRVLHNAYRESGIPLLGAAASGRAADELACATGIRCLRSAPAASTRRSASGSARSS